jgi:hypothetical protein
MAVVCRTEQLGTTVPAYSARHDISVSRQTYGLSLLWPARGVAWPREHRRMRWRAGTRSDPAPRPLAPTRNEALGLFSTFLDGHISRPPALLDAESVTLLWPGSVRQGNYLFDNTLPCSIWNSTRIADRVRWCSTMHTTLRQAPLLTLSAAGNSEERAAQVMGIQARAARLRRSDSPVSELSHASAPSPSQPARPWVGGGVHSRADRFAVKS